jgi:alanine racemase
MNSQSSHSTWVEIDLDAIRNNVGIIKEYSKVQVMAVVKANAYGHGLLPAARAAIEGGATWLGVARIEEAEILRGSGLHEPILVMGYVPSDRVEFAINQDISITLWNHEQLQVVSSAARIAGKDAKIHLKVDTGMGRLGVQPDHVLSLANQIDEKARVNIEGIFTHYARADEEDQTTTDEQEQIFRITLDSLTKIGITPPFVHTANSAAAISFPRTHFNMIRPGIALYGLQPSETAQLPDEYRPAMEWKTILSQVKTLPPGKGISYGHVYVTQKEERIGTLPVGYADGLRRVPGNTVLVGGKVAPIVGRVCMDQVCVQLNDVPMAKEGDEVVIIGSQGDNAITAEQVAERWGTINYEVVCGVSARVARVYV